jgi:uncharacterized protein YbaR (Trm112 family)
MAVDPEFLKLLVAPGTRQRLSELPAAELAALNTRIAKGVVRNQGGATVSRQLSGALVPEGARVAFPIQDGIPILLITEAIPLDGDGGATPRP